MPVGFSRGLFPALVTCYLSFAGMLASLKGRSIRSALRLCQQGFCSENFPLNVQYGSVDTLFYGFLNLVEALGDQLR